MKKLLLTTLLIASTCSAWAGCTSSNASMGELAACEADNSETPVTQIYNQTAKRISDKLQLNTFKETQKTWKDYRDATCNYVAVTSTQGDQVGCLIQFNQNRIKALKKYQSDLSHP